MKTKGRLYIAFILSFIFLYVGIGSLDTDTYSSFKFLKYQNLQKDQEVISRAWVSFGWEKFCTTGMSFENKGSLKFSGKPFHRSHSEILKFIFGDNKLLLNYFLYYIMIGLVFSGLYVQIFGMIHYIHNQDGEK